MPLDSNAEEYANHIPDAVRRLSQRSDEIAREVGVTNVPGPEEPPAEPETPLEPAPEPTAEPAPEPEPALEPEVDWQQRARTAEGRLSAQADDLRTLRGQVDSLQRLLADVQHQPAPVPTTVVTTAPVDAEIPKEDIEAYGEDLITAARRWAMAEVQPRIQALEGRIATLEGGQQRISQDTLEQRTLNALDADPDIGRVWRKVNDFDQTPEFKDWLDQVDPFTGVSRAALLGQAFSRGDAVRVGNIFKSFIAEHSVTTQPPAPSPAPSAEPAADRPTLESMAAPGRAAGTGLQGGAPVEKRVWTRSEISAFYKDCSQGKYASREQERARLEADIFAAGPEGRIR
jgi:hypothetical protein